MTRLLSRIHRLQPMQAAFLSHKADYETPLFGEKRTTLTDCEWPFNEQQYSIVGSSPLVFNLQIYFVTHITVCAL